MAKDPDQPSSFRDRLAAIPTGIDEPVEDLWGTALPPTVRPNAPVARPAQRDSVERELQEAREDDFFDEPGQERLPVPRNRRRRRKWPLFLLLLLGLVVLAIAVPLLLASRTFGDIERVPLTNSLLEPLPGGTNLLLVGTDSRAGIEIDTENSSVILGEGIAGSRTDTILILRIGKDGSSMLSVPRDLWLPIDGGDAGRINSAFGRGPDALVNTVQTELGIPISHYVEVDLAGFIDVVDAVGGVDITIPNPAFDNGSGLDLPTAGTVTLDSTQALAYVRSRFYTEVIDGVEVSDPTSDLGRVQRQQIFLRALMTELSAERNPATLNSMTAAIGEALVIDDATSLTEVLSLLNMMRSSEPVTVTLPTTPTRVGNAAVLVLNEDSPAVLAQFAQ